MTLRTPPKKAGGGALFCFFEIGDLKGPGRSGNMIDTQSLKWPHSGFGPAAFNAMATAFLGLYSGKATDINTSHLPSYRACAILYGVISPHAIRND